MGLLCQQVKANAANEETPAPKTADGARDDVFFPLQSQISPLLL
jgi:hypothetical protein